ncbi:translation initiation factor IF-3 [Anoxybacter fermentans]|uniref:translation initiation factor IF-3 n=1 Tax=Anoxybacter fermentans TaxID=1323375 RepID=UPI000F8EAE99
MKTISKDLRVNEQICAREVRVISPDGNQIGIMPLSKAQDLAYEKGLDLVEVAPQAKPPVCRIMDYGKYKYEQAKKAKEAKKNQNIINVKEIQLSLKIEDHDLFVKIKRARKFLENRDKVKVRVKFRGREITHKDLAIELLDRFVKELEDVGKVENQPKMEGRNMILILGPKAEK